MSLCIVTQARHENANLNEWLSYYKAIGAEKVFLYCNDDEPALMYKTVLPWIETGFVQFFHLPDYALAKGRHADKQIETFIRWIKEYRKAYEWVGFLDIDEYITLQSHKTLKKYLADLPEKTELIFLNWFNFGHNNHPVQAEGRILQAYNRRFEKASVITKALVKTERLDVGFMDEHPCAFQHGMGGQEFSDNPFNPKPLTRIFADGSPFSWEGNLDNISLEFSDRLRKSASISHYYMRHTGYYQERARRGLYHKAKTGSDTYLLNWKRKIDSGEYLTEMAQANEVEDNFLRDWSIKRYGQSGNGFFN